MLTLTFQTPADLHSNLVLLPADDEDCLGARLSSLSREYKQGPNGGGGEKHKEGEVLVLATINEEKVEGVQFGKERESWRDEDNGGQE